MMNSSSPSQYLFCAGSELSTNLSAEDGLGTRVCRAGCVPKTMFIGFELCY